MKRESMRKYSLLGLVLIGASAVTAAVLPKDKDKKTNNGRLVLTSDGGGNNTCQNQSGFNQCTYTQTLAQGVGNDGVGSRTSTNDAATNPGDSSSITTAGASQTIKSITQAIVSGQQVVVNNIHTSADNGQ